MGSRLLMLIVAVGIVAPATSTAAGDGAPESVAANAESEPLAEVTVTAHRLELEKRVSKFVNKIAASENGGEGLARWNAPPVCPSVTGLPRQEAEFVLGRILEIARSAGIPLGAEHCRPNQVIFVSSRPKELLKAMEKRHYFLKLFDGAPQDAPAGMSDWDDAFLKSLYATDQQSRFQRSQMARQMVREIAP